MSLTKEVCLFALESIKPCNQKEFKKRGYFSFIKSSGILTKLINEHFELIDLLKKHDLENLSIKELDMWMNRSLWHVNKVNELSLQLVNLKKDLKQKQKTIDKLINNTHLSFEELKEGDWVWDNKTKEFTKVYMLYITDIFDDVYIEGVKIIRTGHEYKWREYIFEENRFYRMEVKDDENKI